MSKNLNAINSKRLTSLFPVLTKVKSIDLSSECIKCTIFLQGPE